MIAVIRVDASVEMGSGHVMRCLTLAEKLRDNDYNVIFLCREHKGNMISFIKSKGYLVETLQAPSILEGENIGELPHKNWLGASQDFDSRETLELVKDYGTFELLVVDHYAIDYRWENMFKNTAKKNICH
ncbi:hypothetical protein [Halalkalibacter flavus]|uniref:hypothetical protein n=1 Tax=Halalkalibacter flavus TaxID=3090668 RepID=UPI002FC84FDB